MKNFLYAAMVFLWMIISYSCNEKPADKPAANNTRLQLVDSILQVCKKNQSIPIDTFDKYSRLAITLTEAHPEKVRADLAKFYRAVYYFNISHFDSAIIQCNIIQQHLSAKDDTAFLLNKTDILKGTVMMRKGNNNEALEWFFSILPRVEQTGQQEDLFRLNNNIGICHVQMMRYEDAIRWYKKNVTISDKENAFLHATGIFNIADCYINMNMTDSAMKYAQMALQAGTKNNILLVKANSLNTIGKIFEQQGKIDEAIQKVLEAIAIRKELGDQYYIISDLLQLSMLYQHKGKFDAGIQSAKEALIIAEAHKIVPQYYFIASAFWENYYENKQYKEAAEQIYKMLNIMYEDNQSAGTEAIAELEVKYETEKKEQLIKDQKAHMERQNLILYGSIILFVMILLIVYFAYRNYKNKQAQRLKDVIIKEQHEAAMAVLHAQEQERSQLSRNLHDGAGQTLSGLKMNLQVLQERATADHPIFEKSMQLLNDAIEEIRDISHQILPNNILRLGLSNALQIMVEKINAAQLNITLNINGNLEHTDNELQLMLYRILQESINNVIKHAKAKNLSIILNKKNNKLYVSVIDDGVGFDTGEMKYNTGIGLSNIITRVRFLKGNISITSEFNKGTQLAFDIPLSES